MSEFKPVTELDDLNALDSDEIVEGYWSGYRGDQEPGNNHSRAYWHGWRNGRVDGKYEESDDAQRLLAQRVVAASRAH